MSTLSDLKQRYHDYMEEYAAIEQSASITDGLMGFGRSPKNDPCHETFYRDVSLWVQDFLAASPSPAQIDEAAFFILQSAYPQKENTTVFWILYAIHGHAAPLIPLMTTEARHALSDWYDKYHPRFSRMPVQKKIAKLLKAK